MIRSVFCMCVKKKGGILTVQGVLCLVDLLVCFRYSIINFLGNTCL